MLTCFALLHVIGTRFALMTTCCPLPSCRWAWRQNTSRNVASVRMQISICKVSAAGSGGRGGGSTGRSGRTGWSPAPYQMHDDGSAEAGYSALGMGIGPSPHSQPAAAADPRTQQIKLKIKPLVQAWWRRRYKPLPPSEDQLVDYCVQMRLADAVLSSGGQFLDQMAIPSTIYTRQPTPRSNGMLRSLRPA